MWNWLAEGTQKDNFFVCVMLHNTTTNTHSRKRTQAIAAAAVVIVSDMHSLQTHIRPGRPTTTTRKPFTCDESVHTHTHIKQL